MIKVFIGHDPRETVAFHVLSHSIQKRASQPVSITPIALSQLGGVMWRERNTLQSTDFSFSRFLTPFLCDFEGWALFMDCDMLMLEDIAKLWALRDKQYAVMCVKHNHTPTEDIKFLGAIQTRYDKKNWSSVMLLNCKKCTALTPEYVNKASGLELHRFKWLESDDLIGEIPHCWNHLVDYDPAEEIQQIANLHYTIGGPYFKETENCGYAAEWFTEYEDMTAAS
jgi:hypothetical protein